ncbi:heat-inducible transcriptional repressor HrcA [Euhalothece natronophila Z-M001]|uniref:Heat-inducible transcription repressor HrcA n=1 Tax=Euhalothece natronophila Z-M001 TaxID=522448 RepID=A0A5B8NMM7_9CHRO|nr:heat-inducible transcriptional repressor HrcA [Euhalothece natronophila]QDZ40542.1 heat-inducible transcriptional repressor HrcA [Euhalothece natronophila Z-M001]
MRLKERHQHILSTTIRHYVATAEPVSSKTLVNEYDLTVSSATVRNAMGFLEKAGLLYQPHTSAGRIPSDWGYRTYVDQIMSLDQTMRRKLDHLLSNAIKEEVGSLEALLYGVAQLLATLSGYIALITLPQQDTSTLRHLQLFPVDSQHIMLIIITDTYQTQSGLINPPPRIAEKLASGEGVEEELELLSNFLNRKLEGQPLSELANLNVEDLEQEWKQDRDFLGQICQKLTQQSQNRPSSPILVRGISEVLRQPEFSQLQQVQTLLHLLEAEQDQLCSLIFNLVEPNDDQKKVRVRIGSENPLEPMQICSLISADYYQGKLLAGSVGLIGPTRMLYENAIALVEVAADTLSEALTKVEGGEL